MHSLLVKWLDGFAERSRFAPETIKAMKKVNIVMAFQGIVLSMLFWSPASTFLRPTSPPDSYWLSLSYGSWEVWDFAFIISAILLLVATSTLTWVSQAHMFMALCWASLGILWIVGGILAAPTYLFGTGVFAVFIASQHAAQVQVWRAEGVG